MKFSITKAEFDALPDEQKALYSAKGDAYQIKVDGMPDIDAMQAKLDTLLNEAKAAKEAKKKADEESAAAAEKAARTAGDLETIDKSWQSKLDKLTETHNAQLDRYKSQVNNLMINDVAKSIASEAFGKNANLMLPHVLKRLQLEEAEGGEFKTRILDAAGKPSAFTSAELVSEFKANPDYAPVVVTTQAKGPAGALQQANPVKPEKNNVGALNNREIALAAAQSIQSE